MKYEIFNTHIISPPIYIFEIPLIELDMTTSGTLAVFTFLVFEPNGV